MSNQLGTIEQGVRQAVENCLKVQPSEKALIITDKQTIEIGSALKAAIQRIAGEVEFFVIEDFGTRPIDMPPAIEYAIRSAGRVKRTLGTREVPLGWLAPRISRQRTAGWAYLWAADIGWN